MLSQCFDFGFEFEKVKRIVMGMEMGRVKNDLEMGSMKLVGTSGLLSMS